MSKVSVNFKVATAPSSFSIRGESLDLPDTSGTGTLAASPTPPELGGLGEPTGEPPFLVGGVVAGRIAPGPYGQQPLRNHYYLYWLRTNF